MLCVLFICAIKLKGLDKNNLKTKQTIAERIAIYKTNVQYRVVIST